MLGPGSGDQACGEIGDGRMLEADELRDELIAFFQPKLLAGKRVLVTAGPTFEPIDPVRGITNLSSGKMGFAIARAAAEAGADVTLVAGPVQPARRRAACAASTSPRAVEMHDAVLPRRRRSDVFVATAAVADWRVAGVAAAQDQEGRQGQAAPTLRAGREPRHPRRGRAPAEAAVLRRLRRRERRPGRARAREAGAQEACR